MNICEILGLNKKGGDVGIEIEMEGDGEFPYEYLPYNWRVTDDGSLRGYNAEYFSRNPVKINGINQHISSLKKVIEDSGVEIYQSFRAGVHVHVNVQDMKPSQVIRFALLYYTFEDVLVNFCGQNRVGNHFCLRITDADYPLEILRRTLTEKNIYRLRAAGNIRYSSLNWESLFKFGSLEFRAMETRKDLSGISEWAKILVKLRDYSKTTTNKDIVYDLSYYGPSSLFRNIVGDELYQLVKCDNFDRMCMKNFRNCQDLFFKEIEDEDLV